MGWKSSRRDYVDKHKHFEPGFGNRVPYLYLSDDNRLTINYNHFLHWEVSSSSDFFFVAGGKSYYI